MPRQARLDSCGTLHHLIVHDIGTRFIVDDDEDRESFVTRSRYAGQRVWHVHGGNGQAIGDEHIRCRADFTPKTSLYNL